MRRNRYIVTPSHVHIAVDDPASEDLSLETACGRSLVDGLTIGPDGRRLKTLEAFPGVFRCRRCFERMGEDPAPAGFAPRPRRWARRARR